MTDQPIRRGAPREERRFDQTQLREAKFRYRVHRDYAAHFFKWGFATRLIGPTDHVLEVGCGQDLPLVNVLAMGPRYTPASYLGVDLNNLTAHCPPWAETIGKYNFVDQYHGLTKSFRTLGVCIEVIEHMDVEDGRKLLEGFRHCLTSDATLLLSTPVFNGRAAKNHIHEYTVPELYQLLEETGWEVRERYGTFASYPELKKVVTDEHREVLEGLRAFYSDEVTACFLAPLYPDHSRNNVWVLSPGG
jgi:hypothetical protein